MALVSRSLTPPILNIEERSYPIVAYSCHPVNLGLQSPTEG
jgi:hypothetical protein